MKRWMTVGLVTAAVLLTAGQAWAQSSRDRYDDEDEGGGRHRDRFALGLGIGLVDPGSKVETYYTASLRIRTSGRGGDGDRDRRSAGDEGITGYLEPEVGYWSASGGKNKPKGNDTLLGVNLIGVVPLGSVDSFFGVGAGAHFIDNSVLTNDATLTGSDTKFGANAQFGIDLYINRKLSAFGVGRFDLVQDADNRIQSKVYLGLRARF